MFRVFCVGRSVNGFVATVTGYDVSCVGNFIGVFCIRLSVFFCDSARYFLRLQLVSSAAVVFSATVIGVYRCDLRREAM